MQWYLYWQIHTETLPFIFNGLENWSLRWSQVSVFLAEQISQSTLIFFASQMNPSIVAIPLNWQNWRDGKEAKFLIKLMCQFAELWMTSCKPQLDLMVFLGLVFFCLFFNWMNDSNQLWQAKLVRTVIRFEMNGLKWTVIMFHPRLPKVESHSYPPQSCARELSHFCLLITSPLHIHSSTSVSRNYLCIRD